MVLLGVVAVSWVAYNRKVRTIDEHTSKIVESRPERLKNTLWSPMHHELSQVVADQGAVTDSNSEWSRMEALAKNEAGAKFQGGMYEYVQQRKRVVDKSEGPPQAGPVPAEVQAERDKLLELSEELLEQVRSAMREQPPVPQPHGSREGSTWRKFR